MHRLSFLEEGLSKDSRVKVFHTVRDFRIVVPFSGNSNLIAFQFYFIGLQSRKRKNGNSIKHPSNKKIFPSLVFLVGTIKDFSCIFTK